MNYYIIGTAGHVDHGKTQLIKALTGIDTDRLKEEKERGISIELGFASLTLPSGAKAGVVDVPGHEKFVRQMLAGIGGIDLVLMVIAADEGVMPQSREHLEIIDLLQVRSGIVVLTKVDLVEPDWSELVKLEIEETLANTVLSGSPIVEVSALTGQGIDQLLNLIDQELARLTPRESYGPGRMPIDRVFSVAGFGTVVTGTVYKGSITVGEPVVVEPGGFLSRVRSLQVHGSKVDVAKAGQRAAVNLPDFEVANLPRGAVLLTPGYLQPVQTLDISLHYLESAQKPLLHRQRVRFHIGTKEALGRVHLLDRDELLPGQRAYAQILLEEPVIGTRSDSFIIRSYSPTRTIGGGTVLDGGQRKYKRFVPDVLEQLAVKEKGVPGDLVYAILRKLSMPVEEKELERLTGLQDVGQLVPLLGEKADSLKLEGRVYWFCRELVLNSLLDLKPALKDYHAKFSLRQGLPKEELKSKFFTAWPPKLFSAFLSHLENEGELVAGATFVALPGFNPGSGGSLEKITKSILEEYALAELSPPDWRQEVVNHSLDSETGDELLQFLLRKGEIVKVAPNLYFSAASIALAKEKIVELLREKGQFSAPEAKERLNTSRKYLIPLLEYFDSQRITRRQGDLRLQF